MKELSETLKQIKDILESDGKTKIKFKETNGKILFKDVMDEISKCWSNINENKQDEISNILLNKPKYLIGNEKWVLYNYICELDYSTTIIRAGNYAYYKIKNMLDDVQEIKELYENGCTGMLNGETIKLYKSYYFKKNKIIINQDSGKELILYFK